MSSETNVKADTVEEKPKDPPKFVNEQGRFEIVKLDWPVEYDGKVWDQIKVMRTTIKQWRTHWETIVSGGVSEVPMYDAPQIVMDSLDPDDDEKVEKAMERFFPQRYRRTESEPSSS